MLTAARVTGVSALTAAGSITGLTTYDMGNSIHVLLSARFSVAAASATFALALYDAAGTLMGITRSYTLQGDASYYDAGSKYPAPVEIVDIAAASKVGIVLRSLSSGTVDVYIEAL